MVDKKILFRICLIVITGISCSSVSRLFFGNAPEPTVEPGLYSLNQALTLANLTIQAEISKTVPATEALSFTQTPEPTDAAVIDATAMTSDVKILGKHRVVAGETFSCIGRAYRVLPKAIAEVNGMDLLTQLQAGRILQIPDVPWKNMTDGRVCAAQFAVLDAGGGTQPTRRPGGQNNDQSDNNAPPAVANPAGTEPPANEPAATEPPGSSNPPVSNCPPNCVIVPLPGIFPLPTDPPQPGPSEVPTQP